ncbi:uncharacterized protein G2W53_041538 [Senna tora]|uniref:Uncharacterized protein n=1 Tax=Senna tora TaxID=362788 RepID=A0A834SK51_9FABA|nr:uncharacterized protein G2W53_041538 [Senna tora]
MAEVGPMEVRNTNDGDALRLSTCFTEVVVASIVHPSVEWDVLTASSTLALLTQGYGGIFKPLLSSLAHAEVSSTYVLIAWRLGRSSSSLALVPIVAL